MNNLIAPLALPTEILAHILYDAWQATTLPFERTELYARVAAADPRLHQLMVRIAIRFPSFDISDPDMVDINLYRAACDEAIVFANASTTTDEASSWQSLAANSHVRLGGVARFAQHTPEGIRKEGLEEEHRKLDNITRLVSDCLSSTISIPPQGRRDRPVDKRAISALLFHHLRSFPSLHSVYLDCFLADTSDGVSPRIPLPLASVVFLRLRNFPGSQTVRCLCKVHGKSARPSGPPSDRHRPDCMTVLLSAAFPNLRELHIESPVFLKYLDPPRTLQTLTIDAPSMEHIVGRTYSSIVEYNVAAAVRRGFMRPAGRARQARRSIVVRTGVEDPYGWSAARTACDECGIELVKEVVFEQPVKKPEDPQWLPK